MLRVEAMMAQMSDDTHESGPAPDVFIALARVRKGDLDALGVVMDEYQGRLLRYLLRLVKEQAAAEDLFQLTWLRVIEKIRSYDPARDFAPWLFTIARHLAVDHLRRYQPESLDEPLPSGDSREEQIPLPEETPGAMDTLLAEERAISVAAALEELPLSYREVIALRFEEEMKLDEIATFLKIPLSTVKSRLRRGLEGLRLRLQHIYQGMEHD